MLDVDALLTHTDSILPHLLVAESHATRHLAEEHFSICGFLSVHFKLWLDYYFKLLFVKSLT